MNRLVAFQQVTKELIGLLENTDIDRDDLVDKVDKLLASRDGLIMEIVPPYTEEEKATGKKLIEVEKKLNQLLTEMKLSIKKDLTELQAKKQGNQKYINPYNNLMTDGVFYDKRK